MEDDWDLHAVVRGCVSTTATATATSTSTSTSSFSTTTESHLFSTPLQDFNFSAAWVEDPFEPRREAFTEELHDLYKPFFRCPPEPSQTAPLSSRSLRISPLSVLGGLQDLSSSEQLQQQVVKELPQQTQIQPFSLVSVTKAGAAQNPSSRSKKRKNHLKRVCHVPAERLSSDVWSWRKYGQKPIKGSPYPRGYYKCSTLKGCPARKQVERNKSDPGMFIVTYTGEHNHPKPTHRNSLAGSTRQKNPNSDDPNRASEVSPAESLSPTPEKLDSSREDLAEAENDDDDDDEFSVSNMPLDDDFFVGLEDFTSQDGGDCESGQFPADAQFPCLAKSMTTTAGGGG